MGLKLEVNVAELESAAQKIEQHTDDYEAAAANLKTAADDLAAKWKGDSRDAFVEEQEQAFAWYKQMAGICRQYAAAMKDAARRYREGDVAGGTTIRSR